MKVSKAIKGFTKFTDEFKVESKNTNRTLYLTGDEVKKLYGDKELVDFDVAYADGDGKNMTILLVVE